MSKGGGLGSFNREKTHCQAGHPYDEENTYVHVYGNKTNRQCKKCVQARATMQRYAFRELQLKWARLRAARGE